ncbi:unnamed protein product, partial [Meganyctiphanes norvegica]
YRCVQCGLGAECDEHISHMLSHHNTVDMGDSLDKNGITTQLSHSKANQSSTAVEVVQDEKKTGLDNQSSESPCTNKQCDNTKDSSPSKGSTCKENENKESPSKDSPSRESPHKDEKHREKNAIAVNAYNNHLNYQDGKVWRLQTADRVDDISQDRSYLNLPIVDIVPIHAEVPSDHLLRPSAADITRYCKGKLAFRPQKTDGVCWQQLEFHEQQHLHRKLATHGSHGTRTRTPRSASRSHASSQEDLLMLLGVQALRTRSSRRESSHISLGSPTRRGTDSKGETESVTASATTTHTTTPRKDTALEINSRRESPRKWINMNVQLDLAQDIKQVNVKDEGKILKEDNDPEKENSKETNDSTLTAAVIPTEQKQRSGSDSSDDRSLQPQGQRRSSRQQQDHKKMRENVPDLSNNDVNDEDDEDDDGTSVRVTRRSARPSAEASATKILIETIAQMADEVQ